MLAEVGIVLLLFTVGLDFSLTAMRQIWRTILSAGALQIAGTAAVAAVALALTLRVSFQLSVFIGLFVALSSTAIVLKGLAERNELASPHGRLTVGILLLQDLAIVVLLLLVPILSGQTTLSAVPMALGRALLAIAAVAGGKPAGAAGAASVRDRQPSSRGVPARDPRRQRRHRVARLADRIVDGRRRLPRGPDACRERVQPPGVRGSPPDSRRSLGAVLHLAGHVDRSADDARSTAARVGRRRRHHCREGRSSDRVAAGVHESDSRCDHRRDRPRPGRGVLVHPRARRCRLRPAAAGDVANAPGRQRGDDDRHTLACWRSPHRSPPGFERATAGRTPAASRV